MIDVWGAGFDIIERYGLLEAALRQSYLFDRVKLVDERGREISGVSGETFHRAFGRRFFSIPRGDLARVIYETVENRVETLYGTSIRSFHEDKDGLDVEFSTGVQRRFDLLFGADGLQSHVRELAFGAGARFERYLGYFAASFTAESYPHREEGAYVSFALPGRQVSRYAMRQNRSAFLFVFAEESKPASVAHDRTAQKDLLRARFGGDGWEVPEILARLEFADDLYLDAVSQIRMPRWTAGRVALVGDAAHSPSLLAGAGAAFAMLGAYVLAVELRKAEGDFTRAFRTYEARLQRFMLRQQNAAARFAGWFAPKTAPGIRLRNRALKLMNTHELGPWLVRRMFGSRFPLPVE